MLEVVLRLLDDRHSEYCGSRCSCPVTEKEVRAWFEVAPGDAKELWRIKQAMTDGEHTDGDLAYAVEQWESAERSLRIKLDKLCEQERQIFALQSKLDAAETCCSRMYQVLGSLTDDFDIFAHPLVQAAMTALEQRTAPDDLLPWPSKHPDQWRLEARKAEEEAK